MSGHEDVLRRVAEIEELAKCVLNAADALRTAHCRALMREASREPASPRVVAGPFHIRAIDPPIAVPAVGYVMTHESCAIPCGRCDE